MPTCTCVLNWPSLAHAPYRERTRCLPRVALMYCRRRLSVSFSDAPYPVWHDRRALFQHLKIILYRTQTAAIIAQKGTRPSFGRPAPKAKQRHNTRRGPAPFVRYVCVRVCVFWCVRVCSGACVCVHACTRVSHPSCGVDAQCSISDESLGLSRCLGLSHEIHCAPSAVELVVTATSMLKIHPELCVLLQLQGKRLPSQDLEPTPRPKTRRVLAEKADNYQHDGMVATPFTFACKRSQCHLHVCAWAEREQGTKGSKQYGGPERVPWPRRIVSQCLCSRGRWTF